MQGHENKQFDPYCPSRGRAKRWNSSSPRQGSGVTAQTRVQCPSRTGVARESGTTEQQDVGGECTFPAPQNPTAMVKPWRPGRLTTLRPGASRRAGQARHCGSVDGLDSDPAFMVERIIRERHPEALAPKRRKVIPHLLKESLQNFRLTLLRPSQQGQLEP